MRRGERWYQTATSLFLCAALCGCAVNSRDEMAPGKDVKAVCIMWDKRNVGVKIKNRDVLGQTQYMRDGTVRIVMPEDTSDYVIAHEFRHAFGYVHKADYGR